MSNFFESVRRELLSEAKSSPNLLSDLAGLEGYIAESYHNRSFIELLQNADDAGSSKFKILKHNDFLFVANNGKLFNQKDLESICRSASSNKLKGKTIGYRGIGFKSVVGYSKEIHVLSGDLQFTFSKERTLNDIPDALRVPLIRIPHLITDDKRELFQPTWLNLKSEGYTTLFVFTGVAANEIENEFQTFEYNSLIFLNNVRKTDISLTDSFTTTVERQEISSSEFRLTLKTNLAISEWLINQYKNSSIAFAFNDNAVTKMPNNQSVVHAFLPTEEISGLGVLINGSYSTDPSRRHLIFDEETESAIKLCSKHILKILKYVFESQAVDDIKLLDALTPSNDPRIIHFTKNSFTKLLIQELKEEGTEIFSELKLCPSWLNNQDFQNMISLTEHQVLNSQIYNIEGFSSFAKYLGATEMNVKELIPFINNADISILGCVQLTKHLFSLLLTYKYLNETDLVDLNILHSNGSRTSINKLKGSNSFLDDSFIKLLIENGLTESDINLILKKYLSNTGIKIAPKITETKNEEDSNQNSKSKSISDWFNKVTEPQQNKITKGIRRWRNAEEQTLEILNMNGFVLMDVSKQNLGYDLDGNDPNGNEIQIEVKSITLPGQKFKLTNNEVAVAQEKSDSFYVAVVRQMEYTFEIALISDPINNLTLNRQCVQWIWECENYEYKPLIFKI